MQTIKTPYNGNGNSKVNLDMPIKRVSSDLLNEIVKSLKSVDGYGSIEIYVQDHNVTQITVRNIKKTKHMLA
jgi:hypothetical protein